MAQKKRRSEARLERQLAKQLKEQEKSVRLRERPAPVKQVRFGADPGSIYHMEMTWVCSDPDCDGVWSWGVARQWSDEDWAYLIEPKLQEFARLTWGEIDKFSSDTGHKMHHNMDTEVIRDEAQLRLMEIEKYEDVIFRFRLGNKKRLWGFRELAEFRVVWFDPTHEIYPTEPD